MKYKYKSSPLYVSVTECDTKRGVDIGSLQYHRDMIGKLSLRSGVSAQDRQLLGLALIVGSKHGHQSALSSELYDDNAQ